MDAVLGIDVGGTFTDFFFWKDGVFRVFKCPSTPDDPSRAVVAGLAEAGFRPDIVVHGSTVATNALLQRHGARTAFVTTRGFADAVVIGRQARSAMYALEPTRPEPIAPSERRFAVQERVSASGSVLIPLQDDEIDAVARAVEGSGAESVAVCFLFSFLHPEHEQRMTRALRERGLHVSASIEVLPEYREYERMSTTLVNAYLSPVMVRYLDRLAEDLQSSGVQRLRVLQSDGGALSAQVAGQLAVRTVLSGPAGGVAGAFATGRAAGYSDLITFDMGGTSTDVSLCPGRILYRTDLTIDGLPVRTPAADIHTVGAGGGSIAILDAGGALRVGPESAGAEPGPACYGTGTRPTVTDAQLVLGRLQPAHFLGGRMTIDGEAAARALATIGGGRRKREPDRIAADILRVANANMERAIRVISVERGYDPRAFTLLAFGGAGPLHACDLAEALGLPRVLVPPHPGVLSAYGMVVADLTRDYVAPVLRQIHENAGLKGLIQGLFAAMEARGRTDLADAGETLAADGVRVEQSLDLRYAGQSYEVNVPITGGGSQLWAEAFHKAHAARYGHGHPDRPVEIVNARLRLRLPGAAATVATAGTTDGTDEPLAYADIWFGQRRSTPIYARRTLNPEARLVGPAVIVQMDATTVLNPGWQLRVDAVGNMLLEAP